MFFLEKVESLKWPKFERKRHAQTALETFPDLLNNSLIREQVMYSLFIKGIMIIIRICWYNLYVKAFQHSTNDVRQIN